MIDERIDLELLGALADAHPEWEIEMVGPVVKIDGDRLPRRDNLAYRGRRGYEELPGLVAGWDVCLLPFAINEATRFISPTKTPEFLAAGLPVVSTAIVDVVRTYGAQGLVQIADADDIEEKIREALGNPKDLLRNTVDAYLATMSWDQTWSSMTAHLTRAARPRADQALRVADQGGDAVERHQAEEDPEHVMHVDPLVAVGIEEIQSVQVLKEHHCEREPECREPRQAAATRCGRRCRPPS